MDLIRNYDENQDKAVKMLDKLAVNLVTNKTFKDEIMNPMFYMMIQIYEDKLGSDNLNEIIETLISDKDVKKGITKKGIQKWVKSLNDQIDSDEMYDLLRKIIYEQDS